MSSFRQANAKELGTSYITCDLQLIHGDTAIPHIQSVVHAEGLDDVRSTLADTWGGLWNHISLHFAILTFNYVHLDCQPVCALLTPVTHVLFCKRG